MRDRIAELRRHYRDGPERHLMGMMSNKVELDKDALETTLLMCRDDNELEAFVDAIPGYLQMERDFNNHNEPDVGSRISNIGSLLRATGKESPLRHRLVTLFASCTNDHRRMDEKARRRRAIICSRAIWEMSSLSIKSKGVTLDLPMSTGYTLNRLTWDTDCEIAASALRTQAIFKRALMEQSADANAEAHEEKGHDPSKDIVLALPEVYGSMTSPPSLTPSPSYQVEQRDKPSDERLKTVTEYTSGFLVLIPHLGQPSQMDLEETKMTFEELCRELQGHFSPADQERLSEALRHSASGNAGMLCTNLSFKY